MSGGAWLLIPWTVVLFTSAWYVFRRFGMVGVNFRGDLIPAGFGITIALWLAPALLLWSGRPNTRQAVAVILLHSVLGLIDDRWGDRRHRGLKGHVLALVKGRTITTGLLKAVGGIAIGLVAAWTVDRSWLPAVVGGLTIALMANAFNLLDLRPGRAGAVFILAAITLIVLAPVTRGALILALIPTALVYIPDSRGRLMMGDAGSNLLGGLLGLSAILAVESIAGRLAVLAFLVALHVYAEKRSITETIERNPVLRRLDSLTGVR